MKNRVGDQDILTLMNKRGFVSGRPQTLSESEIQAMQTELLTLIVQQNEDIKDLLKELKETLTYTKLSGWIGREHVDIKTSK